MSQTLCHQKSLCDGDIAKKVVLAAKELGVKEFIVCPGSRNASFVQQLSQMDDVLCSYWFEERCAAFFALGRCRAEKLPVAVVTTSGTAAAELLPAAMEGYYNCLPLLFITADRPAIYRKTGAPQCAEQHALFGVYTPFFLEVHDTSDFDLKKWDKKFPAHLNVALPDPMRPAISLSFLSKKETISELSEQISFLKNFIKRANNLFVIVNSLEKEEQLAVKKWLLQLDAPIFCEAPSGLRGDRDLSHLEVTHGQNIFAVAEKCGYPIDSILRIGGVPTNNIWRDIEEKNHIDVISISSKPFSGSPKSHLLYGAIVDILEKCPLVKLVSQDAIKNWRNYDRSMAKNVEDSLEMEPQAEQALFWKIVGMIPAKSLVYLGNSSPIRHYDLAVNMLGKQLEIVASRGVNGIDGQISTFLGLCKENQSNWAIIGDLTALYDLAAFWALSSLKNCNINVVVINNGGGKIFKTMYSDKFFLNEHSLCFKSIADFWHMSYVCCNHSNQIEEKIFGHNLIELVPDEKATMRFLQRLAFSEKML